MVDYKELDEAKPSRFRDGADAARALRDHINNQIEDIDAKGTKTNDAWSGCDQIGGSKATESIRNQSDDLVAVASSIGEIPGILDVLAGVVEVAQIDLADAKEMAEAIPAIITTVGIVRAPWGESSDEYYDQPGVKQKMEAAQIKIDDAVAKADEADEEAADSLNELAQNSLTQLRTGIGNTLTVLGEAGGISSKVAALGQLAAPLTLTSAGFDQWREDKADPSLNGMQRAGRAGYATAVQGGSAVITGTALGASAGGAGFAGGGPIGAAIGGAGGAIAGGKLGNEVGGDFVDGTIDKIPGLGG